MAQFPYNPTRILSSPVLNDTLYILPACGADLVSTTLLSLNITDTLSASNLPYSTVSSSVPFLEEGQTVSYTTTIDEDGDILVYAGDCRENARGANLWRFTTASHGTSMNGTWEKRLVDVAELNSKAGLYGANYLASAIAYSSTPNATSEMYIFGGMCTSSASIAGDWQRQADYSNNMLTIKPNLASSQIASTYSLGISPSKGPPIAEAGFSITPLKPTFSDSDSNNESRSQNQNYVLLGGHTQQAFINMSQVALFSLPEQSWTFLPVDSSLAESETELALRDQIIVDSRSGHTAVLTSNGRQVVVLGGWVGDTSTPADPQLAVLEVGEGYGGDGEWRWSIPSQTGPGLPPGSGLYGHGAVMLDGDVMMIIGGYQIAHPSKSRRRRSDPTVNTDTLFLNTSSNSWITSYTHPKFIANNKPSRGTEVDQNRLNKRVGLGVGLSLGLLAILAIFGFYLWYNRRLQRRRDARENELRHLAAEPHTLHLHGQNTNASSGRDREMSTVGWGGNHQSLIRHVGPCPSGRGGPEAERTGLLFEIPSPTRGLRRSLHSRWTYQSASRHDDGRRGPAFSTIHPIDERDEYDDNHNDDAATEENEMVHRDEYNILSNVPVLDPFREPMTGSRSPSPQSPQDRELEIRRWVDDWSAADALMHSQAGRLSPEKTDRTSSTLSDRSARSGFSTQSIQHSVGTISRSISQRSTALFSAAPFRSTTPSDFQNGTGPRQGSDHRRARSLTLNLPAQRVSTLDTYTSAVTPSSYLQSEGEALLGDYPASGQPSPTRGQNRARNWMGSMRRAFTGLERSASTSPEHGGSTSSSPTKRNHIDAGLPRRAASTGATYWQKRQGARDWDVEEQEGASSNVRDQAGNEGEWDVESAVERRVVQVMFTVPKEKLRVINRGPEGDGESILSAEVQETSEETEDDENGKGRGKGKEKA